MDNKITSLITKLEDEILSAQIINEFILLIYNSSVNDKSDILFFEIQNALWHLWRFSKTHSDTLSAIIQWFDEKNCDPRSE
ncbi:MAG: hypothetical protein K2J73_07105 [Oscillospiraceae bacterium]|nr:hypothetical protein [Oscillospiraceae bacterium]